MRLHFILGAILSSIIIAGRVEASLLITEILADPPTGLAGDANNDGTRSSSGDEFVELFNPDDLTVDLTGWTLADAAEIRHTFAAGVVLDPYQYLVVFGAGSPDLPGIQAFTSSTGSLSLNNTVDSVSLFNAAGVLIDSVTYDDLAAQDQSIVRAPGGNGEFVLHTDVSPAIFSPGEGPVPQQPTAAVPEPVSAVSLLLGLSLLPAARPKSRH
ncbi:MAG: lamin tail domain-containing protein [Candidatus Omnitrophica bacterium]|nr:lamin tail domain-containing protein [Candidatus Omnitrophota bacterium]MCB9721454.1 lamin tail domain-containing protein [Candidatus Omnitrophota bacterium]